MTGECLNQPLIMSSLAGLVAASIVLFVPEHALAYTSGYGQVITDDKARDDNFPTASPNPQHKDTLSLSDRLIAEQDTMIIRDMSLLPSAVQKTRHQIMTAAMAGDLELLRPMIGTGPDAVQVAITSYSGDPIDYLRNQSGDGEGHEILAILIDVLSAGVAHVEIGSGNEVYIWPYFHAVSIEKLSPEQRVELFRVVTAGDYEAMLQFGAYNFFRVAITPDGTWRYFIAGD